MDDDYSQKCFLTEDEGQFICDFADKEGNVASVVVINDEHGEPRARKFNELEGNFSSREAKQLKKRAERQARESTGALSGHKERG